MYSELYDQGAALFQRISKLEAFRSAHGLVPIGEPDRLITDLNQLAGSIPYIEEPNTTGQVHLNELHRRVIGESLFLERVYGDDTNWELADVLKIYSMNPVDLFDLEPWLAENKENTLNTLDKLYANGDDVMRIPLSTDIRAVRRKAEKKSKRYARQYVSIFGKFFEELQGIDFSSIESYPTSSDRSYFNEITQHLAISISQILYSAGDKLHLDATSLIRLVGHEGMGHAMNSLLSRDETLPPHLRRYSAMTQATQESVAQYMEEHIFDLLKDNTALQRQLGLEDETQRIIKKYEDERLLAEYSRKYFQFSLLVLADRSLSIDGNPTSRDSMSARFERLQVHALNPGAAEGYLTMANYDRFGNLSLQLMREIRYAAQPVKTVLEIFKNAGITERKVLYETLLRGYWTPAGMIENATVVAKNYSGDGQSE